MAVETLIHSGEFLTYEGKTINVSFYRRTPLNAEPESLTFAAGGGTKQLTIWSRSGDAVLFDPQCNWLNWVQTGGELIVGSKYYKYTYNIECDENLVGSIRETDLRVGIESGMGVGELLYVHVTQQAGE
jgi:hypothetical protein